MKTQKKTYLYRYCAKCGLEAKWFESSCPRCGARIKDSKEIVVNLINPEDIRDIVDGELSVADDMKVTRWPCFKCNGTHYMVMPLRRDPNDYNKVQILTALPQCPIRVWEASKNIKTPIQAVLTKCKIGE